jgi:hypothetical protein
VCVVFDHSIGVLVISLMAVFRSDVRAEVHAGAVPPAEEGLAGLVLAGDELPGSGDGFVVDGFHAFLCERAGVFDGLAALAVGLAAEDTSGAERLEEGSSVGEFQVAGVILVFGFFLGVEVVEVSEELVEPVHGGKVFVEVALVVLSELSCGVAKTLERGGHGDVGLLPALLGARESDLGHSGAYRDAAADEGGASGGAALLAVVVGEGESFAGDAVNVGGFVAHHAAAVVTDVPGADVVSPDDENVRFVLGEGFAGLNGDDESDEQRQCGD